MTTLAHRPRPTVGAVSRDRAALGAFLRSRRDRLTPAAAGIEAFPGPRRVPGLRKEELAVAAGVSPDYYSRLEQGRQPNVSVEVLDALARALRLDPTERAHLRDLAAPDRHRHPTDRDQLPDPGLLRLMVALDHVPVLLTGRAGRVLARNALLTAVLGHPMEPGTSFPRFLLQDPLARDRIENWADFAAVSVAALRRESGRRPADARLARLIAELRRDEQVDRWWGDHQVRDYASVRKHVRHPQAGRLSFDIEAVTAPHEPDQVLTVYTVQPDSPTARLLPLLAAWTPEPVSPPPAGGPR
jgi:transcriptional regulator with XRE-family HTH domain